MKLLYKIFKMDIENRDDIISMTSSLGIFVNIVMALTKIIIGILSSSIAIVSEGVNNATDIVSAVLTLVGTKLAKKHPDEKHPFGYGRIEYLASLIISALIMVTGVELIKSSVESIFEPAKLNISVIAILVIAASAIIKFALGTYTEKMGKKADSGALIGVGLDAKNDSYASIITIVSSLVFVIFNFSIDAYAGILVSFLILKAGFDLLKDTVSDLIGRAGEKELASQIYKEIENTDIIISAADMMLHNYGPDYFSGTVNVEIDHEKTVGEIYEIIHALQLRIMHEYKVIMVFGIYAVDYDHENVREIRKVVADFVQKTECLKSFHAVYLDEECKKIYLDFIVDYCLRDWDKLRTDFCEYIAEYYPDYSIELTIETEFV